MMLTMRGNVTRVSSVRPLIRHMIFQCARCGKEMWRKFDYGKLSFLFCNGRVEPLVINRHLKKRVA
jgi:DNA replicative helicase MCM subunit Mcm2 (Cdc46/Mcm family)